MPYKSNQKPRGFIPPTSPQREKDKLMLVLDSSSSKWISSWTSGLIWYLVKIRVFMCRYPQVCLSSSTACSCRSTCDEIWKVNPSLWVQDAVCGPQNRKRWNISSTRVSPHQARRNINFGFFHFAAHDFCFMGLLNHVRQKTLNLMYRGYVTKTFNPFLSSALDIYVQQSVMYDDVFNLD